MSLATILWEERKLGVVRLFAQVKIVKKWQIQLFDLDLSNAKPVLITTALGLHHAAVRALGMVSAYMCSKVTPAKAKYGAHPALHVVESC